MRTAIVAVVMLLAAVGARAAAAPAAFQAWVEQDGRRAPLAGVVHLKARPFSLILRGAGAPAYFVATSVDAHALGASLGQVFAEGHAGAEGDRDTTVFVNTPGIAVQSADWVFQYWFVDESQRRFQQVLTVAGRIEARRDVASLSTGDGRPLPFEGWRGGRLYVLVALAPTAPGGTPTGQVKRAMLVFR